MTLELSSRPATPALRRGKREPGPGVAAVMLCTFALPALLASMPDLARAAEMTNVSTPSGANHGGLVVGNIPCATGASQLADCGKTAPAGAIVGTSDAQTLSGKTLAAPVLNGTPAGSWIGTSGATLCLLNANCTFGGLATLSGGVALPSPANPAGSNFYVDSNGALHFVNSNGDFQGFGAKFSGDSSRAWLTAPFGSGITESSSGQQPNFTLTRNDYFSGGSGLDFDQIATVNLGKGANVKTGTDAIFGATSITMSTSNANIAAGQKVFGSCIPAGTTVASISGVNLAITGSGVACSQGLLAGTQLAFQNANNSSPANSTEAISGNINLFSDAVGGSGTAVVGNALRWVPGGPLNFGGNFVARSYTGRKSSVDGGLQAIECDVVGSGPDDNENRACITSTFGESGPSIDGATSIYAVHVTRPRNAGTDSVNPATATYGWLGTTMLPVSGTTLNGGVYGNFTHVFGCDGGESDCLNVTSGQVIYALSTIALSGQAVLVFAYGANINPGQFPSGNANIPTGTAVSSVLQCSPTLMLSGCVTPNTTQVMLSANLIGSISSGTNITFNGALADEIGGSGYFTDAFLNLTNQNGMGKIKAGTTSNFGTALTVTGIGEDSTNTSGIDYGDLNWAIDTNTHGATLGHIGVTNAGFEVGSPTGGNEGVGSINAQAIFVNGVAVSTGSGTVTTTGSPASGNLAKFSGAASITTGDLSGDCTTSGTLAIACTKTNGTSFGTAATQNTGNSGGTLCLLNASCTFSGATWTWPDGTTVTSSGFTMGAAIAMGLHGLTGTGTVIANNSSSFELFGLSAASSTVPTVVPNRASTTTGMGAQASGNLSLITGGTEIERISSSGIILESGAYFSGATAGVTCSGSPTASFASTNGIVTHC